MSSLGSWPASLVATHVRFDPVANTRANASPGGGSEQAIDMLNDRWMAYLTLPVRNEQDAGALEAFLGSFRGMVNTVDLWHLGRPAPAGTLAGSPTVSGSHAQGASTLNIQTTAGFTVKAGDLVGVSGLLLMASGDATANGSGVLAMPLINRLRVALSNGASITWNKPTAPFRLLSNSGVEFADGIVSEVDLVLGEKI